MTTGRPGRLIVTLDDSSVPVRVEGREVHFEGGESLQVATLEPGVLAVTDGTRRHLVYVAGDGDERWVMIDGELFVAEVDDERVRRSRPRARASGGLAAPMPATVVKIFTAPGSAVRRGDVLIVLEAMKMELPIRATQDGTVSAVHCEEGQLVQPMVPLLTIE